MSEIRIQDDLFEYVNHDWLEKAVIPDDKPRIGGFSDLDVGVEEQLIKDLNEMCETGVYPNDYLKRACVLYKAVKDVKKRNKLGAKPVYKTLARIYKLSSVSQLNRNLKDFVLERYPLPFELSIQEDMKDAQHHCLYISGPSTILPDTTYYKDEKKPQGDAILGLWANMTSALLKYTKLTEEEQQQYLADTIKFDAIIATLVKSSEEWSDYTKMYNPMKSTRVGTLLRPFKYKKLLADLFGFVPETM